MIRSFFVPARLFRRFSHESTGGGAPDEVKKSSKQPPKRTIKPNQDNFQEFSEIFNRFRCEIKK